MKSELGDMEVTLSIKTVKFILKFKFLELNWYLELFKRVKQKQHRIRTNRHVV